MARREKLIDVFADTRRFYQENKVLAEAIEYTCEHTKLYEAEDYPDLPDSKHEQSASIRVSKGKTF